ncbi:MAG: ferredoxin [Pirellulaceae bacterium]|nr:(2Fe-2S)-binding protein [Planctomycetales bacterium]
MPVVKFIKEKKEIEVPVGANLRREALKAGINLYASGEGILAAFQQAVANCHGLGQCGRCRVKILKGMENTAPMGLVERTHFKCPVPTPVTPLALDPVPRLAYIGNEDTMRLACCTTVTGDIEVETTPEMNLFGENFFS